MKPANPIQVVGIKDLDEMELEAVYRIGDRYYGKLQRAVKNMASLVVHIKSYDIERQSQHRLHTYSQNKKA